MVQRSCGEYIRAIHPEPTGQRPEVARRVARGDDDAPGIDVAVRRVDAHTLVGVHDTLHGRAFVDRCPRCPGGTHQTDARLVRIELSVAAGEDRSARGNARRVSRVSRTQPLTWKASPRPESELSAQLAEGLGIRRVVDGVALDEIAGD